MAVHPVVGITLRLIRSSRKTFKFPDAIEFDLTQLLQRHNIRGVFRIRSLRASRGASHRKGFVWTALDEKESVIRFTYQPGDNNTCVKYTLEIEQCTLTLDTIFTLLRTVTTAAPPRIPRVPVAAAQDQSTLPVPDASDQTLSHSPALPVSRIGGADIDLLDVFIGQGMSLAEAKQVLVEFAGIIDGAIAVKQEMLRLRSLLITEQNKLKRLNDAMHHPRFAGIIVSIKNE